MAAVKIPCFDFETATKGKKKDYGLTAEQIRPLWRYARERYFDHGVSYEDAINQLVSEFPKSTPRLWAEVFDGGKTPARVKTKEIYAIEDARRNAIWKAQQNIERADTSGLVKILRAAGDIPRAVLTAFHGGVFPVTHAGGLLLRPTAWARYFDGAALSWKLAGIPGLPGPLGRTAAMARYAKARTDFANLARYAEWRNAKLMIGVDDRAQGILSGWMASKPGWSNRAWLGVMKIRYNIAEQMLGQVPKALLKDPNELPDIMKNIAQIANHATGVTNIGLARGFQHWTFAPQLTASKLLRVTHDPAVTVQTAYKWMRGTATTGEKAAALIRIRNATEMAAGWFGGLYLNDAMLKHFGSNQSINFTDHKKPDWLRFKLGDGTVLASRGPEAELRLLGQLIAVGYSNHRELMGKDPWFAAADHINRYGLYKLDPNIGTGIEFALGTDLFGRPLPKQVSWLREKVTGMEPRQERPGKEQYSLPEYAWTHAPIFLDGPARGVYDDMRARGMSEPDAQALMHAAFLTALEFAGFGGYSETDKPPVPKKSGHAYKGAQ